MSVQERVKKYRDNKKKSTEGIAALRAINRMHSARRRKKIQIKRLSEKLETQRLAILPWEVEMLKTRAVEYREDLTRKMKLGMKENANKRAKNKADIAKTTTLRVKKNDDEMELEVKVLEYEMQLILEMRQISEIIGLDAPENIFNDEDLLVTFSDLIEV